MSTIEFVRGKAKALGLAYSSIEPSTRKDKRFSIMHDGKRIHFGSKDGKTFIDHGDVAKQKAWKARHSKIMNSDGTPAYLDKDSSSYYSWNLLW